MSRVVELLTLRALAARDRRAVLIGLAVLVPALLYMAAVRPYRAALGELRERAAAERALLEREEALLAAAPSLSGSVDSAHELARRAAQRLIHAPNLPLAEAELTGMLETIAALSSVLLQEMRAVEAPGATGADRAEDAAPGTLVPLRLAVRGESDLEGVLTFLQRIEQNPLLLRIAELSIEPVYEGSAAERRATGVVRFALILEAFAPALEVSS